MKISLVVVASLTLNFIAGCAGPTTQFTPTTGLQAQRNPKDVEQVQVWMRGESTGRPTRVAGIIVTENPDFSFYNAAGGLTSGESIMLMRKKAAELGLDGVADVFCAPPGTEGQGRCQGNGFYYQP